MKRIPWITIVILTVFLIISFINLNSQKRETETILPVLVPLSGGNAEQGEWYKRGFEVAQKEIQETTGKTIKLIFEDTKGDSKTALSAYENLKSRYDFSVIFTWGSGIGLALTPVTNKDHIVQFGFATAADSYSTPNDYTFRNFPKSTDEIKFLVSKIKDLGINEVGIFSINNDYGKSLEIAFKKQFEDIGGKITYEDVFNTGQTDFRSSLLKLKDAKPKAIYLISYPTEGALILKQSRESGFNTQYISSTAIIGGQSFFDVAGNGAEELLVSNNAPLFGSENLSSEAKNYESYYMQLYGSKPTINQAVGARSYDALKVVDSVLSQCKIKTADCLKDGLYKTSNFNGAVGPISFDVNGDALGYFNFIKVRNGTFVEAK